jgi:hypothetical protein
MPRGETRPHVTSRGLENSSIHLTVVMLRCCRKLLLYCKIVQLFKYKLLPYAAGKGSKPVVADGGLLTINRFICWK